MQKEAATKIPADGCAYDSVRDERGGIALEWRACATETIVWDRRELDRTRTYFASSTGLVHSYIEDDASANETIAWHDDKNRDGRIDFLSESIRLLPHFELSGYDPSWTPPATLGNRILQDTDNDGLFDREGITGDLKNAFREI